MAERFHPAREFDGDGSNINDLPLRYAANPSDALQCSMDLRGTVKKMESLLDQGIGLEDPVAQLLTTHDDRRDWDNLVARAPVFYWTQHTAALVSEASRTYPLSEEEAISLREIAHQRSHGSNPSPPSYLPHGIASGFFVFGGAVPLLDIGFDSGHAYPLQGLLWGVGVHGETSELRLGIRGLGWRMGGIALPLWWSDGGSAEARDHDVDSSFRQERMRFTKWICTAAMFLEQEILVAHTERATRQTAKRCVREYVSPTCHVISLRKEIATEHGEQRGQETTIEWSHRWLVRGHWRRQFFPKRAAHAPIWIHPHVKGPEDKPFKTPSETVFSVHR